MICSNFLIFHGVDHANKMFFIFFGYKGDDSKTSLWKYSIGRRGGVGGAGREALAKEKMRAPLTFVSVNFMQQTLTNKTLSLVQIITHEKRVDQRLTAPSEKHL